MKKISDRLTHARAFRGFTQGTLAAAAGVSQGTIGNIESGSREGKQSLPAIAKALKINHDWLANGEGEMLFTQAEGQVCGLPAAINALALAASDLSDDQRKEASALLSMLISSPRASIKAALIEVLSAQTYKSTEHTSTLDKSSNEKILKKG